MSHCVIFESSINKLVIYDLTTFIIPYVYLPSIVIMFFGVNQYVYRIY